LGLRDGVYSLGLRVRELGFGDKGIVERVSSGVKGSRFRVRG